MDQEEDLWLFWGNRGVWAPCAFDRLCIRLRCRLRVCTVLAGLSLLGTLLVLALVLARYEEEHR